MAEGKGFVASTPPLTAYLAGISRRQMAAIPAVRAVVGPDPCIAGTGTDVLLYPSVFPVGTSSVFFLGKHEALGHDRRARS